MHIPAPYQFDFWVQTSEEDKTVELSCLLPTGIVVLLEASKNATLQEIKEVRSLRVVQSFCLSATVFFFSYGPIYVSLVSLRSFHMKTSKVSCVSALL